MKNEVSGMSIRQPRVSFGIPVCNGEMTIRKTLDSLLAQGAERAATVANKTLETVRERMGFLKPYA